ncbi:hypothetical protein [Methylobacterium platani]|uniref:Uncharacterized protein n=2 Tax=Methylobacterium platani TaxID=427683 RepID=A0A179S6S0_9HYPH|nr:hypothetical protein [Methylobacterium platani]KMO22335.1 hypothetical protein SQ03_01050 [Methylobacterium platani JCM 14648]OAS22520.1 hypothetical protein A5481_19190 [Methylobacterium platani]
MNFDDVVYEVGQHYVVRVREDRRGRRREAYQVRVQGPVMDRVLLTASGRGAQIHAIDHARLQHCASVLLKA